MKDILQIADKTFNSRLFTGTGKFSSNELMSKALLASESELITVALKRVEVDNSEDQMLQSLQQPHISLLPNTSGVRNAKEAVFAAQLAREALETNWVKLEIHPDPKYLLPDPIETLKAAEKILIEDGDSMLFSPEGQRTLTGEMGEFKKGGFHFAKSTNVASIVPVGLIGAYRANVRNSWIVNPGKLTTVFGEPITPEDYKDLSVEELRDLTKKRVSELLV